MGFQIYQREKSQALDLLDRITNRLTDEPGGPDDDDARDEAIETVTRLSRTIDKMTTQLNREIPVDLSALAGLLRCFDDQPRSGESAEWFARYFSNFNVNHDEFLLAAGYALPERVPSRRFRDAGVTR